MVIVDVESEEADGLDAEKLDQIGDARPSIARQ
jgi:hypothetical protein